MRLAIMDTNAFNTIIAAVKGAVSTSVSRPMYKNIRLELRSNASAASSVLFSRLESFWIGKKPCPMSRHSVSA